MPSGPMELGLATPTTSTGRKEVKLKRDHGFAQRDKKIYVSKISVEGEELYHKTHRVP